MGVWCCSDCHRACVPAIHCMRRVALPLSSAASASVDCNCEVVRAGHTLLWGALSVSGHSYVFSGTLSMRRPRNRGSSEPRRPWDVTLGRAPVGAAAAASPTFVVNACRVCARRAMTSCMLRLRVSQAVVQRGCSRQVHAFYGSVPGEMLTGLSRWFVKASQAAV